MLNHTSRFKIVFTVFCVVALACSIFLRVWHLGDIPGINGDEAFYGVQSLGIIRGHPIQWFTPNGNFLNMLFYGPCMLLHLLFRPSFALIRSIAVACGLLALGANYLLCRRIFDGRTALISTVALAVLPEDIAQGRYGYDPSQSLLADILLVYPAMLIALDPGRSRRWAGWTILATVAALSVHPTNVFLFPFVMLAVFYRWRSWIVRLYRLKPITLASIAAYLVTLLIVVPCVALTARLANFNLTVPVGYARLFSGVIVYQYIAGSFTPAETPAYRLWLWSAIPLLVLAMTLAYGVRILGERHRGTDADRLLFRGWMVTAALFFIIGGAIAFRPGNERYALCLILPGTLCVCRFALAVADRYQRLRIPLAALGACVSALLLTSFYVDYFQYIEKTGGTSESTFRAGPVEPKLAAYRLIEAQAARGVPIVIVAADWGTYQSLAYLAAADHRAMVLHPYEIDYADYASYLKRAIAAGQLWEVEFDGSAACNNFKWHLTVHKFPWTERQTTDFAGRPVVDVIHWTIPSDDGRSRQ